MSLFSIPLGTSLNIDFKYLNATTCIHTVQMLEFISYIMFSVQYPAVKDKLIQTFSSTISNLLKHTIARGEHSKAETGYKPCLYQGSLRWSCRMRYIDLEITMHRLYQCGGKKINCYFSLMIKYTEVVGSITIWAIHLWAGLEILVDQAHFYHVCRGCPFQPRKFCHLWNIS